MMRLGKAFGAGRLWGGFGRPRAESGGGATIACASAAPLVALALAVGADWSQVSRFRAEVQTAADAASLAAAGALADREKSAGDTDADRLAERVAASVFARGAPRGAGGAPTVAIRRGGAVVTATVGYKGLAPSNFGAALGYGAISVAASAESPAFVADSAARPAP